MINDVSGLRNPDMIAVAVERRVPVVVMHTPVDDPRLMQAHAHYDDVVGAIVADLTARAGLALEAGDQK